MSSPHEMVLAAWLPIPPTAKGRPRFARASGRAYTPASTQAAERTLRGELAHATTVGESAQLHQWPMAGPLELELGFSLAIPASWSKRKAQGARDGIVRHTSRPDVDNLGKLVMDAATGVLWVDDSQLVRVALAKWYGPTPGTTVTLFRPRDAQ